MGNVDICVAKQSALRVKNGRKLWHKQDRNDSIFILS